MEKLSPLKIVDAMPNYGVKEDPVYPEKNLLSYMMAERHVRVRVTDPWLDSATVGQYDSISLMLAKADGEFEQVSKQTLEGPITFPLTLEVSNPGFADDQYHVLFRVQTYNGKVHESEAVTFTVDRRIPAKGLKLPIPVIDDKLLENGVTTDYLKRHCDVVQLGIPRYPQSQAGDYVVVYFGPPNPYPVAGAGFTAGTLIDINAHISMLAVPGALFRGVENGVYLMHYRIFSRAGGASDMSVGKFIRIDLDTETP
ncbi:hypothetical protein ATI02_6326 [Pseudomonas baetica]|uniref:Uncharacterized protein n=1 Tax=Pseudomonas baetica TaxID=674054 RepID=A0ABX4Q8S7_9PSED|nr:hypothetical protein [Pseudomonas baetica]PKA73204.1 hypothetical protein ATI02_6326 [Pseudomonas baetica]PTC18917.1 hypothetical protein C0J26_15045 [Pseudomonas baetica]